MKLVYPKIMTRGQETALKICMASSKTGLAPQAFLKSLAANPASFEQNLNIVAMGVPIPKLGSIDALAVDHQKKTVLMTIHAKLDTVAFLRTLNQAEWVHSNSEIFGHFLSGLDLRLGLRSIIFSETISADIRTLLNHMTSRVPEVFEYRSLVLHEEDWIVLHRYLSGGEIQNGVIVDGDKPLGLRSLLTEQEINDFFETDSRKMTDDEDVTTRCLI